MKVNQAELVISAVRPAQYPSGGLPEIAMVGRSNVGKSSLINTLLNRKKLAYTSAHPGKTQTLNFYLVNQQFYLVDLPGYGYARVAKSTRAQWGKMMQEYLLQREPLQAVIQLVDIRHLPSQQDQQMYAWLKKNHRMPLLIATKCDKVPKGKWTQHGQMIMKTLGEASLQPIPFSSFKGIGKNEVWAALAPYIGVRPRDGLT